ncbi:MAG: response regulator transcription factor [Eubacteriales bacterium]|nr:response regulator transcription factor [Eubacteriales bacterium]
MQRIFIVEDDFDLADGMAEFLIKEGYAVDYCRDFENVERAVDEFSPDLLLLDLNLPEFTGYHWCSQLRSKSQIPIMIISGNTEDIRQEIALELGADDYLEKPFSLSLLLAKVKALLRRSYVYELGDKKTLSHLGLELNLAAATVAYEGRQEELSQNELRIMAMLLEAAGNYVSSEKLVESLWGQSDFVSENTLAVNISRIRKKILKLTTNISVVNRKGIGYAVQRV